MWSLNAVLTFNLYPFEVYSIQRLKKSREDRGIASKKQCVYFSQFSPGDIFAFSYLDSYEPFTSTIFLPVTCNFTLINYFITCSNYILPVPIIIIFINYLFPTFSFIPFHYILPVSIIFIFINYLLLAFLFIPFPCSFTLSASIKPLL